MVLCEYCGRKPAIHEVIDDQVDCGVAMICDDCHEEMCLEDQNTLCESRDRKGGYLVP